MVTQQASQLDYLITIVFKVNIWNNDFTVLRMPSCLITVSMDLTYPTPHLSEELHMYSTFATSPY